MFRCPMQFVAGVICVLALAGCAGGARVENQQNTATTPAQIAPTQVMAAPPTAVASPVPPAPSTKPFPLGAGWWDNSVCYEVFVRSFYDSNGDGIGDITGLIEKLDYINDGKPEAQQDLGANCIWLMPVAEASSYHGYDTTDYYTVEHDYGTNDDFKRLVAEAHKRGIKIIIDLVLNHTSRDHPWFKEALANPASPYHDYYIWSAQDPGYRGPWGNIAWHRSSSTNEYYYGVFGDGLPDLNYRNPVVTAEAQKISNFWRNEMGADGFRLDAIKHLIEDGTVQENTPETLAWLRGYRAFLEQAAPNTFTVGEIFDATPKILEPYFPDQLDTYFVFDIGNRILTAANQGNGKPFASAAQRVNDDLPFQRYAPFLTNHDQNRSMALLGGDIAKAKLAATALLTLPGLPFMYYGEEIGMVGSKGNPPKVDEPLRTPMQWTSNASGFTTGTPWEALQSNTGEVNVAAQDADTNSLLNHYRKLIHIHTASPALAQGSLTRLNANVNAIAAYVRHQDDQVVLVVINFGREALSDATLNLETSTLAPGTYQLTSLLDGQAGAALTVGEGGKIGNYAPLPTLAAQTSYVFQLVR